jgi:5'-deoxynucleotidase YfbR-like HD superfamily hydrolase
VLKDKYGKESEIIKCYVKEIIDLPHITSSNPRKIAEFSEKLTYCVQALETMKKLNLVNGNVSMTLEKLSGIRGDLVRTDASWESWDFVKLVDSLHQRLRRNLLLRLMIPIATIARNY